MGKGNKSTQSGKQTIVNELPEYARPFYENLMKRTEAEALNQYTPYQGQRIAQSGNVADIADSRDIVRGVAGSGIEGLDEAMGTTRSAIRSVGGAMSGLNQVGQDIGQYSQQLGGLRSLFGNARDDIGAASGQIGAFSGQMGNVSNQIGQAAGGIGALQGDVRDASQYDPTQFDQFMFDPARQFTGAEVDQYMSPYMDAVVERQKMGAIRDFDRGQAARDARAVSAGAFGGSRQAVADYLAEEGLGDRLADIEASGRQQAFQQAAQQFGADRAAQFAQQQAQAGELGRTQTSQEAANQFAQQQQMAGLGQEAGLLGQQAGLFGQQLGALQGQAGLAGQQAALAGQQAGITGQEAGLVGQQAGLSGQQAGILGQQAGLAGQAAQLGTGLAGLGGQQRAADIQAAQLLEGIGKQQLGEQQAGLDMAYQDFLRQQGFNKDQLGFMSNILQGVPVQPNRTTTNYQSYNPMQQALGAGIAGLGLYRGMV